MPRTARASAGGLCYHVLNRGNAGSEVFHEARDYAEFVELLYMETEARNVRFWPIACCPITSTWFLAAKGGRSEPLDAMALTSHVRRYHRQYRTSGHIWQGRFRAFPIQADEHLLTVLRYVEQNPIRLKDLKLRKPERWAWSRRAGRWPAGTSQDRTGARGARSKLAQVGAGTVDRRGVGRGPAQRGPGHAFWRREVATADCSEIGARIDHAAPRPAAQDPGWLMPGYHFRPIDSPPDALPRPPLRG